MIADLFAADTLTAAADAVRNPRAPKPPEPKFSAWNMITALPRGVTEAAAQVGATAAEVVGGAAQVLGANPEMLGPVTLTDAQRRGAEQQRELLARDGIDMTNDVGNSLREAGRLYRPDNQTAHAAEQVIYGFSRGAAKIVGGALLAGPAGVVAAGAEEGVSVADDLLREGVTDPGARAKAGAVQGAGLALAALPLVGQSLKATAALYLAGGPGGFMAQQALTRQILENAGFEKQAAGFDPFDPVGLTIATLLPAGFAAYGIRGQRQAARAAAERDQAAADEAPRIPPEVVDAAMVTRLSEQARVMEEGAALLAARGEVRAEPGPTDLAAIEGLHPALRLAAEIDQIRAARAEQDAAAAAPDAAAPTLKAAASDDLAAVSEAAAPRIEPEAPPPVDLAAQERATVELRKRDAVLTKLLECMQ